MGTEKMTQSDFLCEIYSEEIPARFQKAAQEQFLDLFEKKAKEHNLKVHHCDTFITPCRLILNARMDAVIPSETVEKRGPRIGAPEKAIQGFCQGAGVDAQDLLEKDGYYCVSLVTPEQQAQDLLPKIMNEVALSFSWPKVMRYPQSLTPWVRPVRYVLAVYDGKPFVFHFEAFNLATAGHTFGHRFLAPSKIEVTDFQDYKTKLETAHVIIDAKERESRILANLKKEALKQGVEAIHDDKLLSETAGLVEYPGVFMGALDSTLFKAPEIVLTTSMRFHQKCFAFRGKDGALAPYFAAIVNTIPKDGGKAMAQGYEMGMLKARLEDARFFYEHDLKTPLESFVPKLDAIIFHEKLGSLGDKVRRLKCAVGTYSDLLSGLFEKAPSKLTRAIELCKTDLLTQMVGEFGELQGVMGTIYAKEQGEDHGVAQALREHYLPMGAEDDLPETSLGTSLSLMDKMDTLVGFIGNGILPTGSKDPFALRRACLGVIRLLLHKNIEVDLKSLIEASVASYEGKLSSKVVSDVFEFFTSRLLHAFKDEGMDHDVVEACLSQNKNSLVIPKLAEKTRALAELLDSDIGKALHAGFKRAANIFDAESKKDKAENYFFDSALLTLDAEKGLYSACEKVQSSWSDEITAKEQCALLASLKPSIDAFFNDVIVNDSDASIRTNRLGLLQLTLNIFEPYADFRKLEG